VLIPKYVRETTTDRALSPKSEGFECTLSGFVGGTIGDGGGVVAIHSFEHHKFPKLNGLVLSYTCLCEFSGLGDAG
jgi:hypothetical protein